MASAIDETQPPANSPPLSAPMRENFAAAKAEIEALQADKQDAATVGDVNARVAVENNGTLVGTRRAINFIPGTNVSLTIADDAANEEVDVTINATGGGGSVPAAVLAAGHRVAYGNFGGL